MSFITKAYKSLSNTIPLQSLLTPLTRLVLSILLLKVVASRGGYQYLDTVALAVAFSSIFSLFSLPGMLRVRGYLGIGRENREKISWRIVPPHAVFAVLCSLVVGILGAWLFSIADLLSGKAELIVFSSVLISSGLSSSLVAVEHICGRVGQQVFLRRVELIVFVLLALISIVVNSAVMAACAIYASTAAARFFILFGEIRGRKIHLDWVSLESFFSQKNISYWLYGPGLLPFAANLLQVLSSVAVYSWVMHVLPTGVVGQVAVAYRLAGPIQVISGQLAYSTWEGLAAARGAKILGGIGVFTVLVSLFSPIFFTHILKLPAPADGVLYSVLACLHLVSQGICQVKGAELYSRGHFRPIFYSALPHGVAAIIALWLIGVGLLDSLNQIMVVLLAPTLFELVVLFVYSSFSKNPAQRQ